MEVSSGMQAQLGPKWSAWGTEQVTSNLVVASSPGARVLPHPRYCAPHRRSDDTAFLHFIGYVRHASGLYAQARPRGRRRAGRVRPPTTAAARPEAMNPFRWLSPAGSRGRLSIFIFHRVLPQPDPLLPDEPDAERFDAHRRLHRAPFPGAAAVRGGGRLAEGRLPAAAACITFDDGYADNLTVAAPILLRHGVTGDLLRRQRLHRRRADVERQRDRGGARAPNGRVRRCATSGSTPTLSATPPRALLPTVDMLRRLKHLEPGLRLERSDEIARRAGLPARCDLMMTSRQVVALRDLGMEIGAHTVSHPILQHGRRRDRGRRDRRRSRPARRVARSCARGVRLSERRARSRLHRAATWQSSGVPVSAAR